MRTFLEITFRNGKPLAAYLYLPRKNGDLSATTKEIADSIRADITADGRVIGLELLSPSAVTLNAINTALASIGLPAIAASELAPLAA
jgi:uncharacterized protein YuzE